VPSDLNILCIALALEKCLRKNFETPTQVLGEGPRTSTIVILELACAPISKVGYELALHLCYKESRFISNLRLVRVKMAMTMVSVKRMKTGGQIPNSGTIADISCRRTDSSVTS
jgi:hypothetical protein